MLRSSPCCAKSEAFEASSDPKNNADETGSVSLAAIDFPPNLQIRSPKRRKAAEVGWEAFFPYYAGYPEVFAYEILGSAGLPPRASVLDPWNGSGTTTLAASRLGLSAHGADLNPVMVVVARARLLRPSEAVRLKALLPQIWVRSIARSIAVDSSDPLLDWFQPELAEAVRSLERAILPIVCNDQEEGQRYCSVNEISSAAAIFYVGLFSACRTLVKQFATSNPTWLRMPKKNEQKIDVTAIQMRFLFEQKIESMMNTLSLINNPSDAAENLTPEIQVADSANFIIPAETIDLILSSPPYCTRIDYTAATRIELAILGAPIATDSQSLRRQMIGSPKVPKYPIDLQDHWGPTCLEFLKRLQSHRSKASAGYYYKTHLDYFDKIAKSVANLSIGLKRHGYAILVVQDSHYKDIHNDLPTIFCELAEQFHLQLWRREDFHLKRSMSAIHPHSHGYGRPMGAIESVLCFRKI